ncbi:MAG TPA: FtsX-like permease family protein [Candidatus Saccharimonadales bacterium]|nr:FtsX-like permease family protein [Candidatus Saccharimonadales bacterium]
MRYEMLLALRYLGARRRLTFISFISIISVVGVTVGVAALILALGGQSGLQHDIMDRILGANAHITVFAPPGSVIDDPAALSRKVEAVPGVRATSPVCFERGLITSEMNSTGTAVFVKGIDPAREPAVTDIGSKFTRGSLSDLSHPTPSGMPPIALGKDLARELSVQPGDRVLIMVPRLNLNPFSVMPRSRTFEVVGILDSGFYDYDASWAHIDIDTARKLFALGDGVSVLEVRVEDVGRLAETRRAVAKAVGSDYPVTDMVQMNRTFFGALKLEKLAIYLAISLIVIVAGLNIVSTLVLTVMGKIKDIGALMAMGATSRGVMLLFMTQGLFIGVLGTVLGSIMGLSLAWWLDAYKIISLPAEVYFVPYIPFRVGLLDFGLVAGTAVAVSFLATLYPAWMASRLDPVEALRYE